MSVALRPLGWFVLLAGGSRSTGPRVTCRATCPSTAELEAMGRILHQTSLDMISPRRAVLLASLLVGAGCRRPAIATCDPPSNPALYVYLHDAASGHRLFPNPEGGPQVLASRDGGPLTPLMPFDLALSGHAAPDTNYGWYRQGLGHYTIEVRRPVIGRGIPPALWCKRGDRWTATRRTPWRSTSSCAEPTD